MATRLPWVGREEELSRILGVIGRSGRGGLLVRGPAGMGKSRLMDEALARIPASKAVVHRLTATRATATIPMGAVSALLPHGDRASLHGGVLAGIARHLVEESGGRRVVVAVDDAHLLDDASAALVHHLATASPVFVLGTVRDAEPSPDAIGVLVKDRLLAQVTLSPLSPEQIHAALEEALAGPVNASVVHRLARLSDGNPLLVSELLASAVAERRLVRRSGLWCLDGPWLDGAALPSVVAARLSRLPPAVYAAAELVALGEPVGASELERLVDAPVLHAAEREGLFVAVTDGRRRQLRLAHPLYAEALRAAITPLRARSAYRQLADTLAATGARRRGDALRLAVWSLDGGRRQDADLLLRAARERGALADPRTAERLALAAEDVGGGVPARLLRAEAMRDQGRAAEADRLLSRIATEVRDQRQAAHVAAVRASNLYFGLNRPAAAGDVLSAARDRVRRVPRGADTTAAADELDALQTGFWFNAGRVGDAADLAAGLLRRSVSDPTVALDAAVMATVAHAFAGRPRQGLRVAEDHLRRARAAADGGTRAELALLPMAACLAHAYAGEQSLAEQLATAHYGDALHRRADELQGQWALALGQLAVLRGRVGTARRWLREASALIDEHAPTLGRYGVAYGLCFSAEAAALAGDVDAVDPAVAQADALVPAGTVLCNRGRPLVWAAAARGELSTARRQALAWADTLSSTQAHFHEALACHDVVRLGAPQLVRRRLQQLGELLEGALGRLYARHAAALAGSDADGLAEVSADFSRHGLDLFAAEAAAEASHAYRQAGHVARADVLAERARALAAACEGARTPALVLAHGSLPITPREREVAALAGHGLSNREIAERLCLSERTVHNHLHRAYTKLGVRSRRQLRSVLS